LCSQLVPYFHWRRLVSSAAFLLSLRGTRFARTLRPT
jgi:hypothetical protein